MKLTNLKNGTVTITGVTHGDLRLWAAAVEAGSFEAGDHGGPLSAALLRLARALRVPTSYTGSIGNIEIISGTSNRDELYEEPCNLVRCSMNDRAWVL